MAGALRIVVADDEADMRDYFKKILPRLGHTVVGTAENGRELVEQSRKLEPDLVITDIKMPDMDRIEAAAALYQQRPVPVILVSAHHDPELIKRAEADHIMGYLVKPIKQQDMEPVIGLAMKRFEQFQALRQEAADLRHALEDRKMIERAKGILMKKVKLDEQDAFRRLQKLASDKNLKLVEIARMLVTADEALQPLCGRSVMASTPAQLGTFAGLQRKLLPDSHPVLPDWRLITRDASCTSLTTKWN
jgi:AmiR/NasT family two-component response regulator